ncbi:MAG: hypothetical protein HIU90_01190 [Proteobacteria bacterium]|nr:hypothetical protein [Pseudomonadota bacterium]
MAGTYYVWAEQINDVSIQAVSGAIVVSASVAAISYTVNQPASVSIAAGSGTLALNGGVSPPQSTATQIAFSTSNTVRPTTGWQNAAIIDNNTVWAIYATVPASAGTYYIWVETTSGTNAVVSTFSIQVT